MSAAHHVDFHYNRVAQRLLLEEVARIVDETKERGETLRTGHHAGLLFAAYPDTFSVGRIVDELVLAASKEGVPVEISRP